MELENLFDVYSRSFQVVRPGITDTFMCPLCMDTFGKEDIYNGKLSIEHVPPKSIKAVVITMTCTRCNNTVGTKLQRFMANDVSRKELEAGKELKKPLSARIQMPGFQFDTEITSTAGRTWKSVSPLSILPPNLKSLEAAKIIAGTKASITLKGMGTKEALDRAYLHSSYLALFSLLGYPYISQPFMEAIRQQINQGNSMPVGSRVVFPTPLKAELPFLNPREKEVEFSLLMTAPDFEKSCFALFIAGELVLMPIVNNHYQVIHSEYDSLLSDLAKGIKRRLPFVPKLLEIDPLCKYSVRYVLEKGRHLKNVDSLKLSPSK